MEPLGPSPELVAALTEVVRADGLQGKLEDAIRVADRALGLAEELGLPRPARALGYRGLARANLGDPGSLQDQREALELATQAGQGRDVALLHNNLGVALWAFEGPAASLEVLREGIDYGKARGLTEMIDVLTEGTLDTLIDTGEHEEALTLAAELAPRLEASEDAWDLIVVRCSQARVLVLRGESAQVAEVLDWLEATARGTADGRQRAGFVRSGARRARAGRGRCRASRRARVLPRRPREPELLSPPPSDGAHRPGHRRARARRASRERPRAPLPLRRARPRRGACRAYRSPRRPAGSRRSLRRCRGSLGAVRGRHRAGVRAPRPGEVSPRPFPTTEASPVLQHAHEIFKRLRAAPALAETDALLASAA